MIAAAVGVAIAQTVAPPSPAAPPPLAPVPAPAKPPAKPEGPTLQNVQGPLSPAKQRPNAPVRNCTTAGCHAEQVNHKVPHGPVAVGACSVCHQVKDDGAHTFTLKREGKDLCAFCHIDKTGQEGPVVHKPVAEGQCTNCHNPHGSEVRAMLREKSLNDQCLQCHTDTLKGAHAHKPAAENCTQCHQSHSAQHEKLLKMDKHQLCVSCHQDVQKIIGSVSHPHKPVTDGDCYKCHTPHASAFLAVLRQEPKDLCLSCHKPIGDMIGAAKHPHSAVTDAKACLNCHSPHGSDHAKQLKASTVDACMACHDKPIQAAKGRTVAAVNELRVDQFHKHGPIQKDDCAGCHAVHGGSGDHLLVAPYSSSFYIRESQDAVALCFKCHDAKLLAGPVGDKQTAFRDGQRNLHAVHTGTAPGQQARSCRACHTVHASRFENMIADSVKFGEWALPLNYVKTPTGGSCAPGCHKPQPYDREVPGRAPAPAAPPPSMLEEPPTAPASSPAATPAPGAAKPTEPPTNPPEPAKPAGRP